MNRTALMLLLAGTAAAQYPIVIPIPDSITGLRNPYCCALAGNQLFVGGSEEWVIGVNCSTNAKTGRIQVRPYARALCSNADSSKLYCCHARPIPDQESTLTVIDPIQRQVLTTLSVGLNPVALAFSPIHNRVYTANLSDGTVTAVCAQADTVIGHWPVRANPQGLLYSAAHDRLYVRHWQDQWLSILDAASGSIIDTLRIGRYPTAALLTPDERRLIVAFRTKLAVVDCSTHTRIAELCVGRHPFALAYHPQTNRLFCALHSSDQVAVIDCSTYSVLANIPVGNSPRHLSYDPAANRIVCSNRFNESVTVIDPVALTVTATIATRSYPAASVSHPSLSRTYVLHEGNAAVSIINPALGMLEANLMLWEQPVLMRCNPNPERLYVLTAQEGLYGIYPWGTRPVLWSIDVGPEPAGLAYDPPGNKVYVSNRPESTVTVYDGTTGEELSTIHVGAEPTCLEYNSLWRKLYCARSMRVQVIDCAVDSVRAGIPSITRGLAALYNPANDKVYFLDENTNSVVVVDGETNGVLGMVRAGDDPTRLGLNPYNQEAYCTYPLKHWAVCIADSTNQASDTLSVPGHPTVVWASGLNGNIYLGDRTEDKVYVFDPVSHQCIDSIAGIADPAGIAYHSYERWVYCTDKENDRLLAIDSRNQVVQVWDVPAGPTEILFDPNRGSLFVQCEEAGAIAAFDYVGIEETKTANRSGQLRFEPNPARGRALLRLPACCAGTVKLELVSASGRVVKRVDYKVSSTTFRLCLDLNGLSSGVYVARIQDGGRSQSTKLIVER